MLNKKEQYKVIQELDEEEVDLLIKQSTRGKSLDKISYSFRGKKVEKKSVKNLKIDKNRKIDATSNNFVHVFFERFTPRQSTRSFFMQNKFF